MSFCNNQKPTQTPCCGLKNPMNGICERVCIQTKKVFDACLKQITLENYRLQTEICGHPKTPLTYVGTKSTQTEGILSDTVITPIADSKCSRVQTTVTIPVEVTFVDDNGEEGTATAEVVTDLDVVMLVPDGSVIPVTPEAVVGLTSPQGQWYSENVFDITACVTVVLKIVAEVDLLVPSYGYCFIPPCNDYTKEVCSGVFDLPLFP